MKNCFWIKTFSTEAVAALTLPHNMLQIKTHGIAFLKGQEIHFKQPNISLLYYFGKPSKNTLVSLFIDRLTNYRFRYFQAPVFSHFSPKLFLRFQLKMLTAHISILKFTSSFFSPLTASVSPFRQSLLKMQYPSLNFEAWLWDILKIVLFYCLSIEDPFICR